MSFPVATLFWEDFIGAQNTGFAHRDKRANFIRRAGCLTAATDAHVALVCGRQTEKLPLAYSIYGTVNAEGYETGDTKEQVMHQGASWHVDWETRTAKKREYLQFPALVPFEDFYLTRGSDMVAASRTWFMVPSIKRMRC